MASAFGGQFRTRRALVSKGFQLLSGAAIARNNRPNRGETGADPGLGTALMHQAPWV